MNQKKIHDFGISLAIVAIICSILMYLFNSGAKITLTEVKKECIKHIQYDKCDKILTNVKNNIGIGKWIKKL